MKLKYTSGEEADALENELKKTPGCFSGHL